MDHFWITNLETPPLPSLVFGSRMIRITYPITPPPPLHAALRCKRKEVPIHNTMQAKHRHVCVFERVHVSIILTPALFYFSRQDIAKCTMHTTCACVPKEGQEQ